MYIYTYYYVFSYEDSLPAEIVVYIKRSKSGQTVHKTKGTWDGQIEKILIAMSIEYQHYPFFLECPLKSACSGSAAANLEGKEHDHTKIDEKEVWSAVPAKSKLLTVKYLPRGKLCIYGTLVTCNEIHGHL